MKLSNEKRSNEKRSDRGTMPPENNIRSFINNCTLREKINRLFRFDLFRQDQVRALDGQALFRFIGVRRPFDFAK